MWDLVSRDERVDGVATDAEQGGNVRHVEDVALVGDLHGYAAFVRATVGAGVNAS